MGGFVGSNRMAELWADIKATFARKHVHTLNGAAAENPAWYAPASAGGAGQYLVSAGSGAPVWATLSGGNTVMPNGYPAGAVCLAWDPAFNPAAFFGGTWTKRTDTYLFLGITVWKCVVSPAQYLAPLDMYPPVVAFLTYDSSRNPAAEFGGTWTLVTETYLFMGIKIYKRVA